MSLNRPIGLSENFVDCRAIAAGFQAHRGTSQERQEARLADMASQRVQPQASAAGSQGPPPRARRLMGPPTSDTWRQWGVVGAHSGRIPGFQTPTRELLVREARDNAVEADGSGLAGDGDCARDGLGLQESAWTATQQADGPEPIDARTLTFERCVRIHDAADVWAWRLHVTPRA